MKPYSLDLRERVLAALDSGMKRSEVVHVFQISSGSLKRWLRQRADTGDVTPRRPPGRPRIIPAVKEGLLRFHMQETPDATLAAHATQWRQDMDTPVSRWTIAHSLRRMHWSRKKNADCE